MAHCTRPAAARAIGQVRPSEVPWLRSLYRIEFPKCPPFDGPSRALLVHNWRANPPLPATLPGPPSSPPCPLLAACWLRALRGPTLQHYRHDQARQRACGAQGGRRGVIFDGAHEGPAALSDGHIDAFPTQPPPGLRSALPLRIACFLIICGRSTHRKRLVDHVYENLFLFIWSTQYICRSARSSEPLSVTCQCL